MGLPMFREPEECAVSEEPAAKLDRAAAARRSTIRREPTVRPNRASLASISDRLLDQRREGILDRARVYVHDEERDTNSQIAELEAQLERLRNIRLRTRARFGMSSRREHVSRPDSWQALRSAMDFLNQTRPAFDEESVETSGESAPISTESTTQHLPRPPRESGLRFEVAVTSRSGSTSPRRYRSLAHASIPTPPYSADSDPRDRSIPDGPLPDGPLPDTEVAIHRIGDLTNRLDSFRENEDGIRTPDTPPPESWEASYPPLRRVSHLSPRPLPNPSSRVDGLGDRRRSPSPSSDNQEEETWATLLTTMDNGHSSTTTSFASIGSEPANRSNRSSQNTATSFGEIGQIDDSCDLDLPSGITEEDVREIRAQHRQMRSREPDGPVITGPRALREHRERWTHRVELSVFQNILERMQRREEIPDEWWAAVGLTPDVVRGNT